MLCDKGGGIDPIQLFKEFFSQAKQVLFSETKSVDTPRKLAILQ